MEEAQQALAEIAELARKEQKILETDDQAEILAVDREIELSIGKKERAIGAYQLHIKEHDC